jgi:TetR/AcrR family transcriptional regulator, mexJK operon transcriptional repressor
MSMDVAPKLEIDRDGATPSPRGRRKDGEKGSAILEAARDLFMDHPFDRVSMDMVADAARVSKATVYSHFPSKQALFVAAISKGCLAAFDEAAASIERGRTLEATLNALALRFVDTITSEEISKLTAVMTADGKNNPELAQMFFAGAINVATTALADVLASEVERGTIFCANPFGAATQFLAMVLGNFELQVRLGLPRAPHAEIEAYTRDCTALFLKALTNLT